jgi:hypothetical protein
MFLIDAPFVSEYLKHTLQSLKTSVVQTAFAAEELQGYDICFISESDAIKAYHENRSLEFYTNSENALDWILTNFPSSELAKTLGQIKDKVRFRDVLSAIHPDYYYQGCPYSELNTLDPESIPFPIILKPSIGFFSLGVQRIDDKTQLVNTLSTLDSMTSSYEGIYPAGVLDNTTFILEAVIPGEEFAIDCYYDGKGQVVILNMMRHLFASGDDVNDRVYITSSDIIAQHLLPIQTYLNTLGSLFKLKNFQAHIEVRIHNNDIKAIEINPLRFGGWCSTADLAQYAWGMNLYQMLTTKKVPDWDQLIQREPQKVFALVVLNNSTGIPGKKIASFDYDKLLKSVTAPLELRRTDFSKFPLFGFLMCHVPADDPSELEELLHSDLTEFVASYSG